MGLRATLWDNLQHLKLSVQFLWSSWESPEKTEFQKNLKTLLI